MDKYVVIFIGIIFALIILINPFYSAGLILLFWVALLITKIKMEHYLYFLIIVYPILPFHAGIDLGYMLPVVKLQRILIALLILCWVMKRNLFSIIDSFYRFSLTFLFIILIVVYSISFISQDNIRGFIFETGNFFLESFMITFVFYDFLKDKGNQQIRKIFFCMVASCLLPFLIGIFEYVLKYNIFSVISPFRGDVTDIANILLRFGVGRVKGAFPHSIIYGVFFAMVVPAGLFFLNSRQKDNKKGLFYTIVFLSICFTGCYFSLSRLALIVFLISSFALLILFNIFRAAIIFTLASILFSQPYFMSDFKERATSLVVGIVSYSYSNSEMINSAYTRIRQIKLNYGKFLESPYFGYGGTYYPGILDNYYLSLLIKLGIVGSVTYLLFFILPMIWASQMFFKSKNKFSKYASFTMLVIVSSTLLIFSVLSITHYLYIYFIYLGVFMAIREKDIKERKNGYINNYS